MDLLERDTSLAALTAATVHLDRDGGRIVLIPGEPGIGKTALIQAFVGTVARTLAVWIGRCDNLVAARPLSAVHEALRTMGQTQPAALAASLPALMAAVQTGDIGETMALLREALAAGPPTVFIVDDLQWADDATIDTLSHLGHRVAQLPVLFVLAYRPEEATAHERLRRFLGSLPTGTSTIQLSPFSRAAVQRLAQTADVDRLCDITGGNPFYVTEVLASSATEVPPTVASAVLARLGALPRPCRLALERLAVWPGEIDFDVAERLVGDLDVLAAAEQSGLLRVTTTGLSFRHEIARRATEASLPRLRRRRLDADVIAALRDGAEAHLPRLVHHALSCDDAGTVVEFAPRAAQYCVRVGAHRQALALYAAILRFEDRLTREQLASACDAYAWELCNAHRFTEAVDYAERALRLLAGAEPSQRVGPLVRAARHRFMSGARDQATAYATLAVQLATGADARSYAQALTSLGSAQALTGQSTEAARLLALVDIAPTENADLRSLVLNYRTQCQAGLTDDERIDGVRDALSVALHHAAYEPAARAYTTLAELLFRFGRYDDLAGALEEGLPFVREHGFWSHAYTLESHRGLLSWRLGDLSGARREFEVAVGRYDDAGMLALYSAVPLARLRARTGDRTAGEQLRSGWDFALRLGHLGGLGYAGAALAEWGWLYRDRSVVGAVLRGWSEHAARPTAAGFDAEIRRYAALAGITTDDAAEGDSPWAVALGGDHHTAAARWRAIGDPYELAIELAQTDDAADAHEAARLLEEYGATPARRWIRERLLALGVRTVPRGSRRRTSVDVLTPREADVAALVAQGLTNAEIAEELFVSVRTVDHHVSAVLGKLGVDGRRAVAARLRQGGPGFGGREVDRAVARTIEPAVTVIDASA